MHQPGSAPRRRLWPVFVPLAFVVVLALGWSGFWFLAAGAAAVTTSAVLFGIRESRQHAERANAMRPRSQARVSVDGGASVAPGFAGARLRLAF